MSTRSLLRRGITVLAVAAAVVVAALVLPSATRHTSKQPTVPVESVQRRDVEVTIEATGTIEPVELVEVKSKASGQIIRMPVETGSLVRSGQLLAQIDTVDVQNAYDQAQATLVAAQAKVDVSAAQKQRSDTLFAQQLITADAQETTALDFANAQAQLVTARTQLDLARQRREDATVRAAVTGTVLTQAVTVGQVISSATSSVTGGTTLLVMADLTHIRLRALVSERDIGSVRTGQAATVTVEAYPQRSFPGTVVKIEPQAVIEQSVTLFPVLIAVSNEQGLLLPGMNGEVQMLIDRHQDVLAVSTDAVRTMRELDTMARAVGAEPDSARVQLRAQMQGSRPAEGEGGAGAAAGGGRAQVVFVRTATGFEPRLVRVGLANFDVVEITHGLAEGDEVAVLSVAEMQTKRTDEMARIRERVGNGMPGVPGGSGTTRGRSAGAATGAR